MSTAAALPLQLGSQLQSLISRWPPLAQLFKGLGQAIGLDAGAHAVKAVKVKQTPGGPISLIGYEAQDFPPKADSGERAHLIRDVLQKLDSKRSPVVTAVGGAGAVLRLVPLPKMSPQELKTALSFEAEKHIPFKLDETFFDSWIAGDLPGGRMEVLLAAARKELVNGCCALFQQAGTVPAVVDLEPVALANAWEVSRPALSTGASVLLHLGSRGTILNFFNGLRLEFTREIPLGGGAFTQALMQGLHMDESSAERIKCEPGDRAGELRTALQPSWEEWLAQCRVSFDFYESQCGHTVERMFLSGGSARLTGFASWAQESSGLPTEVWNPTSGLQAAVDPQSLEVLAPSLGVAVGCALRGVFR